METILSSAFTVALAAFTFTFVPFPLHAESSLEDTGETYRSGFEEPKTASGHSLAPVVGYDPMFQFVIGAAYFFEGESLSFGIDGNLNFNNVYQAHARMGHQISPTWRYELNAGAIKGFQGYYGEGGATRTEDFVRIWGERYNGQLRISQQLNHYLSVGTLVDYRNRNESASVSRIFPDEAVLAVGLTAKVDTRQSRSSNDGFVLTTDLLQSFPTVNWPSRTWFTQAEGSFVVYKEILNGVIPDVVAAFRVMGGISLGQVPYTFRYQLGGADRLNGYMDNRFRGQKYYLQQTELRFPIWKMVGGAVSLGFGDITDDQFTSAKMAYSGGVRIGLPPDWVSKIRIDVSVGRDQMGVFAQFGQSF